MAGTIFAVLLSLLLIVVVCIFMRAVTAKLLTGKWPHEDELAKEVYDSIP